MGHLWIEIEISDLERKNSEKVKALVDTGATLTVIPKQLAENLNIKAPEEADEEPQAGRIKLQRGIARVKLKGKEDIASILISDLIDKVLIGVVILDSLGFVIDPTTGTLKSVPLLLYFSK